MYKHRGTEGICHGRFAQHSYKELYGIANERTQLRLRQKRATSHAPVQPSSPPSTNLAEAIQETQRSPYVDLDHVTSEICEQYGLSPREREVFEMPATGRTSKRTSEKLFVSESTAKSHCYRIYRKMRVHNQQELLDVFEDRIRESIDSMWKPMPRRRRKSLCLPKDPLHAILYIQFQ